MKPEGRDKDHGRDPSLENVAGGEASGEVQRLGPKGDPSPPPPSSTRLSAQDADAASLPQPGDAIAEKYRIDGVLGKGGMGVVFSATHMITGKRVALKWMLPSAAGRGEAAQRFVREAQAAGRINHPNVVNVYDVGTYGESVYLVMELLEGEPLSQLLRRGPLGVREAISLLMPALRGVAAAHEHGVVHRDLKPENVFLCRRPDQHQVEPKVLDFGISKVLQCNGQMPATLTQSGAVLGTPCYMAPEQALGEQRADHRVDVYALGAILYEALTGSRPFEANSYNELIVKIATEQPEPMSARRPELELPATLDAVVQKAMAREPDDRYSDIERLARALEPFAEGVTFRPKLRDSSPSMAVPAAAGEPLRSELNASGAKQGLKVVVLMTGILVAIIALGRSALWMAAGETKRAPPEHFEPAGVGRKSSPAREPLHSRERTAPVASASRPVDSQGETSNIGAQQPVEAHPPQRAGQDSLRVTHRSIRVVPAAAQIFVDGELLGSGEVVLQRPPDRLVELRVTAPGHRPWRRRKIRVSEVPQTIKLRPLGQPRRKPESRAEPECLGDLCESPYGRP